MALANLAQDRAVLATRAAQGLLQSVDTRLVVDGHWGSFTDGSYARAPAALQQAVRGVTESFGSAYTPANLKDHFSSDRASVPKGGSASLTDSLVTGEKARAMVERAYNMLNAGSAGFNVDDLQTFASLEAARKRVDGKTYFDASAVNRGGFTGLYQFNKTTWDSVKERSPAAANLLGTFEASAKDPWMNTVAMVAYAMLNAAQLRRLGYKGAIDSRALYGAHQQGANGFVNFKRTGVLAGTQSKESVAFLKGGPPPTLVA